MTRPTAARVVELTVPPVSSAGPRRVEMGERPRCQAAAHLRAGAGQALAPPPSPATPESVDGLPAPG